jgi:cbb3-type cytochrome oxidase subunit 3
MRKLGVLLILLICANFVSASYFTGDINVYTNGEARFDVSTDIEVIIEGLVFEGGKLTGRTQMLTQMGEGLWTFELDFGRYDNIFVDVHLPRSLYSITEIKGVDSIIDLDNKEISLVDSGTLDFEVSYKLKNGTDYSWLYFIIILLLLVLVVYLIFKKKEKKRLDYILPLINDNEKKIVELLMKRPLRQKDIRRKLDIPKASFSRYMLNLEKKKIIIREGEGKNKMVRLK